MKCLLKTKCCELGRIHIGHDCPTQHDLFRLSRRETPQVRAQLKSTKNISQRGRILQLQKQLHFWNTRDVISNELKTTIICSILRKENILFNR